MFARYTLLSTTEQAPERGQVSRPVPNQSFLMTTLAIISIVNLCVLGASFALWSAAAAAAASEAPEMAQQATPANSVNKSSPLNVSGGLAVVEALPTAYVPFQWHTPWGAANATEADVLWDNLNTAHGQ
jgi:hypothetical protein